MRGYILLMRDVYVFWVPTGSVDTVRVGRTKAKHEGNEGKRNIWDCTGV